MAAEKDAIDSLSEKIGRLIADNRRLRDEYERLAAQRDRLSADNHRLTEETAALRGRIACLELGKGLTAGTEDKRQARARINRLMREIDRCIALMNR